MAPFKLSPELALAHKPITGPDRVRTFPLKELRNWPCIVLCVLPIIQLSVALDHSKESKENEMFFSTT